MKLLQVTALLLALAGSLCGGWWAWPTALNDMVPYARARLGLASTPENPSHPGEPLPPPGALIERSRWGTVEGLSEIRHTDGSLYVAGTLSEAAWFGRGTPRGVLRGCSEALGCHAAFIARFSARDELEWVRLIHHTALARETLRVLPDGATILAAWGNADSRVEIGEGAVENGWLRSKDDHAGQVVVARFDASGKAQWWGQLAMPKQASVAGVEPGPDGDTLIWAPFFHRLHFYIGDRVTTIEEAPPADSGVHVSGATALLRVDPRGQVVWAKRISDEPLFAHYSAPLPLGGVALTGTVAGPAPSKWPAIAFVAWLDAEGTVRHLRHAAAEVPSRPAAGEAVALEDIEADPVAIAADPSGTVAVTGYFEGKLVVGSDGADARALESAGKTDLWVALFDSGGGLRWADSAGGPTSDIGLAGFGLRLNPDAVDVFGGTCDPVTFARGTPAEYTLEVGTGRGMCAKHARWSREGQFLAADRAVLPPDPIEPSCCIRESCLTFRSREQPWPQPEAVPNAPEVEAWVKQSLGRIELGWTLESDVQGLLPKSVPARLDGLDGWRWTLKVPIPGGRGEHAAELSTLSGVAWALLMTFEEGEVAPTRQEIRRFFAALDREEKPSSLDPLPMDVFCPVTGMRQGKLVVSYDAKERVTSLYLSTREKDCASEESGSEEGVVFY